MLTPLIPAADLTRHAIGMDIARRAVDLHDLRMALRRSEYGGLEVEISGPAVAAP